MINWTSSFITHVERFDMSFYANGRVSKPIRSYWTPELYETIMDCLTYVSNHLEEYAQFPIAQKAGHLAQMLAKYAYMPLDMAERWEADPDADNDDSIQVRVSMFPSEMAMINWLQGYLEANDYRWGSWPDDVLGDTYMLELVDKLEAYEEERERKAQLEQEAKEARAAASAAKKAAKQAKEDELKQRIVAYIAQCEHDGVKPSRRKFVDAEHTKYMVDKVWSTLGE